MKHPRIAKTFKLMKAIKRVWFPVKKPAMLIKLNHTNQLYTEQEAKEVLIQTWRLLGKVK